MKEAADREDCISDQISVQLLYHLTDSAVKLVITDEAGIELSRKVASKLKLPQSHVVNLSMGRLGGNTSVWDPCRPDKKAVARVLKGDEVHETAFRCYSSGTTGRHKGVNSSNYNAYHLTHQYGVSFASDTDRFLRESSNIESKRWVTLGLFRISPTDSVSLIHSRVQSQVDRTRLPTLLSHVWRHVLSDSLPPQHQASHCHDQV